MGRAAYALNGSHDTYLDGGQMAIVREQFEVRQALETRLRFYLGEWFLDLFSGTPWFQRILVKPADGETTEVELKRRILQTEGVTELVSFEGSFVASTRRFKLLFEAQTGDGPTGVVSVNV